ncbi:MAG: 30S ribosomal protein S30e [Candidatus Bathyarchaeota archaeon]|nr:30S ribosomal protein S30e [Candidatus Bathyarchaeota archaeon]
MPTHGSLTKAGKVRSQTPKIEGRTKKSPNPRTNARRTYEKRVITGRRSGQNYLGMRGRGRRR